MSNNFMSYEDALEVLTPYAEAIKAGGGGSSGLTPRLLVYSDTGSTVTAVKGTTTITGTEIESGVFRCDLNDYGDWTVDGTAYGSIVQTIISVDTVKEYIIDFVPDGSTATPTDDVTILLHCADIWDKNYTTIGEVLADSTTLSALIADSNAVDYMARSTTFASSMSSDEGAMTLIGLNNYCSNTLLADNTWNPAICNSAYFEKVLNVKVPKMTGNTTPSGECFAKDVLNAGSQFYAFNGNTASVCVTQNYSSTVSWYIGYYFDEDVTLYKSYVYCDQTEGRTENITLTIQGTKDKSTWTDLTETLSRTLGAVNEDILNTKNIDQYIGCRVSTYGRGIRVREIQFYGRRDV